jgi:uncharacterized integral membrane protein
VRTHRRRAGTEIRAYTQMVRAINKQRKRHRWLIIAGGLAVLFGGLSIVISPSPSWWQASLVAVTIASIVFVGGLLGMLVMEVLNHGNNVDKALDAGLAFLREAHYSEPTLACIKERAQSAGAAATPRTLLPIVAIPLVFGILSAQNVVATEIKVLGWEFVIVLVVSMLVELLQGSTAFIVLDTLAEFRCESEQNFTEQPQQLISAPHNNNGIKASPHSSHKRDKNTRNRKSLAR